MYDVLYELSLLSLFLQARNTNILAADYAIDRTIRIITSLSPKPGEDGKSRTHGTKMLEAKIAEKDMKFKSISLQRNRRHIRIDSVEFIERLTQHISTRLKATAFTKQSTKTV
jgi:hypothetical protein